MSSLLRSVKIRELSNPKNLAVFYQNKINLSFSKTSFSTFPILQVEEKLKNKKSRNSHELNQNFKLVKKLPHKYIDFLRLINDESFFKDVRVLITHRLQNDKYQNSSSSKNNKVTNDFTCPFYQNEKFNFFFLPKSRFDKILKTSRKKNSKIKFEKTAFDHFYFGTSSRDIVENADFEATTCTFSDTLDIFKQSVPKSCNYIEYLCKILIYSDLSTLLSKANVLDLAMMLLLGGSLGKGIIKPDSDLDLIYVNSQLERPNESYNYFSDWWQLFGREESSSVLGAINSKAGLEKILSRPQRQHKNASLVSDYSFIREATYPIISFKFSGIPIDIQSGNFTALDEVSIIRFIILKYNPRFADVNLKLVAWARKNSLLAENWSSRKFKSFHFASFLIYYFIIKGYLPNIYDCIDGGLFSGSGVVMLLEENAERAAEKLGLSGVNCKSSSKKIIKSDAEVQKVFQDFITFMANHDYLSKIDLLEASVESRFDKYDSSAFYSMSNFVSKYEMSPMYSTGSKDKVFSSRVEAENLKKCFEVWSKVFEKE